MLQSETMVGIRNACIYLNRGEQVLLLTYGLRSEEVKYIWPNRSFYPHSFRMVNSLLWYYVHTRIEMDFGIYVLRFTTEIRIAPRIKLRRKINERSFDWMHSR